jgi:DNA-binding NarL/FixJ family response regulator
VRVVIADDTALLRHGIARLLRDHGIEVCGEAGDAVGLLRLVEDEQPDVALVDIRMPPTHTDEGLVAAARIRERYPDVGVAVLSQYVEAAYALRLLDGDAGGRCGYLLKDCVTDAADLVRSLERIADGEVVVDRELISTLIARRREVDPLYDLSDREREVLALMAEGLSDRGIAERLWVTSKTVESHVRHILQKLGVPASASSNRRVHAVLTYLRTCTGPSSSWLNPEGANPSSK